MDLSLIGKPLRAFLSIATKQGAQALRGKIYSLGDLWTSLFTGFLGTSHQTAAAAAGRKGMREGGPSGEGPSP